MGENASSGPRDPYNLVLVLFKFLGMGCLLPWNFFISVNSYWMYKLRDLSNSANSNVTVMDNGTVTVADDEQLSPMQMEWNSNLSIAAMVPNVAFLLLNASFGHHFKTQPRLIIAMIVIIVMFVLTTVLAGLDTDTWQTEFLAVTLASVVVINIAVAILQGGLSGIAAHFPPHYMGSVIQGQALGGIFAAGTNVLVIAIGVQPENSAFYCFLITVAFMIATLLAFLVVTKTEFYKYYDEHRHVDENDDKPEDDRLLGEGTGGTGDLNETLEEPRIKLPVKINVLLIAAKIWVWILAVFLNFLVTLAVFPAITALAQSSAAKGTAWHDKFFIPVSCFLLFNIGDYLGRILASVIQFPKGTVAGSWIALGMSLIRFAFLPIFLFCSISPQNREITSVFFDQDWHYILAMCFFSLSNGYIGSITMMFAPKTVPAGHSQSVAGSIMVTFLVLGLAVGSALSKASVKLL